jgi:MFS family permease
VRVAAGSGGKRPRRRFLTSLAALSAAASASRPGTTAPGAAAPLAGAPPSFTRRAKHTRAGWLRRSLRACTAEGLFAELINAFAGGALLTGWAIHLGASPLYTGLLVALPQIAQVLHVPGAWSTALLGHRRACLWLVGASRQVLLPLAALPFLPLDDAGRRWVLLAVAGLAAVLGVLGNNAWVAWMGELVPKRIRGRYFGKRTGLCMLGGGLAAAAVGLLLDWARTHGLVGATLAGLQVLACVCGLVTVWLMRQQHDPSPPASDRRDGHGDGRAEPRPMASIAQAWGPFQDRRMRCLFRYHFAWNVAVGVAGSFFALHMLRNLKMGFTMVALHGAATAAVRMMAAPLWGVLIDRLGARPVLAACSFGIAGIPFMWLLPTEARLWPLAIDALLAGLFWSGHALAVFALPLALTRRRERPFYVAAFAAVGGVAFTGATALGGTLASLLPDRVSLPGLEIHNLQVLFVLSGVLRLAAAFLSVRIEEPKARGVGELWSAIADRISPRSTPATATAPTPVPPAAPAPAVAAEPARARRKTRSQAVPIDGAEHRGGPP